MAEGSIPGLPGGRIPRNAGGWLLNALLARGDIGAIARDDFSSSSEEQIFRALRMMQQSAHAERLLSQVRALDITIGIDPFLGAGESCFYPQRNRIDLGWQSADMTGSEKGVCDYAFALMRALRRAWHARMGLAHDCTVRPHDFLRMSRAVAADAEAFCALIAFDLRMSGHAAPWRMLIAGTNGDIGIVYEQHIERDPVSGFDGRATKAAYDQWFLDRSRMAASDAQALDYYDMSLLNVRDFDGLARRVLRHDDYAAAGMLPSGFNYLSGGGFSTLWYDGYMTDANARHLRHIIKDISYLKRAPVGRL